MSSTARTRPGLAGRLLVGQALVLLAGAMTTWFVASIVGPGIFHEHLMRAHVGHTAAEARHVDRAFTSALLISIGIATLTSVAAALAVSWYFSRRVHRSITSVADAAGQIAAGRFGARVADPGLGSEFATLAATYNTLAVRLEAIEATRRRMLGDLAHEMRTPLATIDAHLEAIEDGVRTPDRETLAVIRGSTRRLRRLAEDIGAVSRAEEGDPALDIETIDAGELARAAAETARDRYAAKGVRLGVDVDAPGVVRVDADRVAQVLGNLLDNSLRHTPPGGRVTISCRRRMPWVELSVTDTGEGIAAEHLPHVFDRFYRADTARDRIRGGSGIGLSIARALVEAHGGTISVASEGAGRGASFVVQLPASAD
ncbi:HAMP domain-containing sensor histidine kinase [Nocardioides koreensis]|uniref:histidine kinase n=1 Tax=Nocardioides koreensis TaxID=433651 RepID=A0ABN2ZPV6_9ACTN